MICSLQIPKFAEMTSVEVSLRIASFLPTLLNLCLLVESYCHRNLRYVPLMLQLIMIRKELQLLFPQEGSSESIMLRTILKTVGITLLVFLQVVIGTFTSQPYWFRRINPFIHFAFIYFFTVFGHGNVGDLERSTIFTALVLYLIMNLYINSAFKTLLKVVEQSIAKELNSHRQIQVMFNSLQEGIVIAQKDRQQP